MKVKELLDYMCEDIDEYNEMSQTSWCSSEDIEEDLFYDSEYTDDSSDRFFMPDKEDVQKIKVVYDIHGNLIDKQEKEYINLEELLYEYPSENDKSVVSDDDIELVERNNIYTHNNVYTPLIQVNDVYTPMENTQVGNTEDDIELLDRYHRDIELENINIKKLRKYKTTMYRDLLNKEEDTCNICYNKYTKTCKVMTLKCGHYFHSKCVLPWICKHLTCPTCRGIIY